MCGLVGAAGDLVVKDESAFKQLLFVDSLRGNDSTGIATINRKEESKIVKQLGDPTFLIDFNPFKQAFTGQMKCLIGHNRFATTGKVSRKNAHPFEIDDIIGAHNGTLTNKWELERHSEFDTDSEALFFNIEINGLKDTIKITQGAYALTWYDKVSDTINFLRNKERPLFFTFSTDRKKLFWASEKWMLEGVLGRTDIPFDPVVEVLADHHYRFKIPEIGKEFEKIKLVKVEQDKKVFTKGSRSGGPLPGSVSATYPKSSYPKLPLPAGKSTTNSQSVLEKMYDLNGFVLPLQFHSHGVNEHGAKFVQFLCDRYPTSWFRVFLKSEADLQKIISTSNWEGTVKEVGFSSIFGGYYKIDYASLKIPFSQKKEQPHNVFLLPFRVLNHKGHHITKQEFDATYANCCWCTSPLEYSNKVRIYSEKDCLCEACAADDEIKQYLPKLIN